MGDSNILNINLGLIAIKINYTIRKYWDDKKSKVKKECTLMKGVISTHTPVGPGCDPKLQKERK